jgi:hypothetical protein
MYQTQLLKIRIRPGKTERVVEFLRQVAERKEESLEALRREGMMVESMFLERREEADYLYYYVKSKDLAHAAQFNLQATDALTLEIRCFVSETWGDVSSPEPLLDLDTIPEPETRGNSRVRGKAGAASRPKKFLPSQAGKGPVPRMP